MGYSKVLAMHLKRELSVYKILRITHGSEPLNLVETNEH